MVEKEVSLHLKIILMFLFKLLLLKYVIVVVLYLLDGLVLCIV